MDTATIRERLLARAFVHEHPQSYAAGVLDVLAMLEGVEMEHLSSPAA